MNQFYIANADHAEIIARIVIETGAGVVEHLLGGLVPGMIPATILSMAFMQGEGMYDPDNIVFSGTDEEFSSLLFAYPASEHRIPDIMASFVSAKRLDPARPVLEHAVPGTLYINTFWVSKQERGGSLADALMAEAIAIAQEKKLKGLSLFAWNDNERALRFYARHAFKKVREFSPEELRIPGHERGGAILLRA